jgi:hypothetical protein
VPEGCKPTIYHLSSGSAHSPVSWECRLHVVLARPDLLCRGSQGCLFLRGGAKWSANKTAKGFGVQDSILRDNIACASVTLCTVASGGALFSTAPLLDG